ncbi:hypothetical protein DCAR_0729601 [Daucus carota subsp. sativus]|uniref:TF-B3 domain-containing protein n=1 Tax=Daucus carota subsp. sativus TaxID=79200 RepID=A0AAF0XNA6_DAUCS|nr:hypothetical protein DCAR_0729601 [Daucus carota subsp. sativus]
MAAKNKAYLSQVDSWSTGYGPTAASVVCGDTNDGQRLYCTRIIARFARSVMDEIPKFVKMLSRDACRSNILDVPRVFTKKYGHRIPTTIKIVLRTGYTLWLDYDKKKSQFFGIKELFSDFSVTGGQLLVFTYSGGFMFDLCIIGVDGGEIQYPPIVHKLQDCSPQNVSIREIGWSFIRGVTIGPKVVDEVELPTSFVEHLGRYIPVDLEIYVSCGVKILGGYNRKEKKINGLSSLCNMVGYRHLNSFNVLLLTYYGREKFTVSAFDSAMVEIFVKVIPAVHGMLLST